MLELNWWYIAALILFLVAGYCGYRGGKHDSDRSTERLAAQIDALGTKLDEVREEPPSPEKAAKLEDVSKEYKALAAEYFRTRVQRAAEENVREAQDKAEEVARNTVAETYLRSIAEEAEKLAAAYNEVAGRDVVKTSFSKDVHPHVLLQFEGPAFWAVRPFTLDRQPGSLEFIRVDSAGGSADYSKMTLTGDSIVLTVGADSFRTSLHDNISKAVRANVTGGLGAWKSALRPTRPIFDHAVATHY